MSPRRLVLDHATVIDAQREQPRADQAIHVEEDRIVWVGNAADAPAFEDAEQVDLGGAYLLPGLGDAHAHLMFLDPRLPGVRNVAGHTAYCLEQALNAFRAGITTLRVVGDGYGADIAVRDLLNGGSLIGPRLWAAGEALTPSGGHGADREEYWGIRACDGVDGWRKAARDQIQAGADHLKAIVTGGVIGHEQDVVDATTVTEEELQAAADVFHSRGKPVVVHASSSAGAELAIRVGARSVEHGYFLDDATLQRLIETGTFLTPTLSITHQVPSELTDDYERATFAGRKRAAWGVARAEEQTEKHRATFRRAIAAGVKIVAGSDYAPFPGATHCEIGFMVRDGMSPWQAIVAATRSVAEVIGVADRLGTVEVGKWADLIAVTANPLEDIRNLRHPRLVMRGGRIAVNTLAAAPRPALAGVA